MYDGRKPRFPSEFGVENDQQIVCLECLSILGIPFTGLFRSLVSRLELNTIKKNTQHTTPSKKTESARR